MPMAQGLAERTPSALKCTSLYMGSGIQHYVVITKRLGANLLRSLESHQVTFFAVHDGG